MKYFFTFLFVIFASLSGKSQALIQASIGQGSAPNRVKIYLKPGATQTPANISTLQFNIGIATSVAPKPSMSIVSTSFSGVTWSVTEATEGGYYNFQITTATSPIQPNTTSNTEFEALEVAFTGGPATGTNVSLVTLADGGLGSSGGNSLFLSTGSLASNGSNLYYTRTGTTVNNQNSYDATGGSSGQATSTATVSGILLSPAPANLDLGITSLSSPVVKSCYTTTETVSVDLKNYSTADHNFVTSPVTVSASVSGASSATFTPVVINTGVLAAGATLNVIISNSFNMTAPGTYSFNASASVSGDINAANDAMPATTRTAITLAAGTVSSNINSFCGTGGTPTLTLNGSAGAGNMQWQQAASSSGPWVNVGTGTAIYTPSTAITATTYYRVVATCGTNTSISNTVTVSVDNPQITSAQGAARCGTGSVVVQATGSTGSTLNWYASATGGSLLFTGPTFTTPVITTTTTYYVAAFNGCESVRTAVTAAVNENTQINTQPISQTICSGSTATFSVAAAGTGLGYQWRKNGTSISGATANTFTINTVSSGDVATYDVIVTGTCGTVTSTSATLSLGTPATITTQPASQAVCSGSTAAFSVAASGTGLTYQWRKGGTNITGANAATLTLANVTTADTASYYVVVSGTCSTSVTSSTVILTLTAQTAITNQPLAQTVCQGTSASFTVAATGANLTYQWRRNAAAITGATSSTYSIPASSSANAGTYDVVVTGTCGTITSNAVALTVNAVTAFTTQPSPQTVCAGATASFTAAASGTGTVSYQWRKGGVNIAGATSATYTIASVVAADASNYDVVATASCGAATSTAVALALQSTGCTTAVPNLDIDVTSVQLTPNMVKDRAMMHLIATRSMKINWSITDAVGRIVMRFSKQVAAGQNDIYLTLSHLAGGTYYLTGETTKGNIKTLRFIRN